MQFRLTYGSVGGLYVSFPRTSGNSLLINSARDTAAHAIATLRSLSVASEFLFATFSVVLVRSEMGRTWPKVGVIRGEVSPNDAYLHKHNLVAGEALSARTFQPIGSLSKDRLLFRHSTTRRRDHLGPIFSNVKEK